MTRGAIRKVHFIGIGGTGMCGLAEILLTLDYTVHGSDLVTESEAVERLVRMGAQVFAGHAAHQVHGADLVVVSSAVREENPEVAEARRLGIPVLRRGQMLAEIMRLKYGVAVAGAHGKTTTTSLVGHLLSECGLDPTVVVGGRLRSIGSHARLGSGDILVAEADESDGSFLELLPTIAVVTNIDREHLDHYRNLDEIRAAFLRFMRSVPFYGAVVLCADDPHLQALAGEINRPVLTYGTDETADVWARGMEPTPEGVRFRVVAQGAELGEFRIPVPGRHNVLNALAAVAVALFLGVDARRLPEGLATFSGVGRRFEVRGEAGGIVHVDDYGHHPTEIAAVLSAAREVYTTRRLVVLFQPHRYSRTMALHEEFAGAFEGADLVVLAEIYPAGEVPVPGVTSELLVSPITRQSGVPVVYAPDEPRAVESVLVRLAPGDLLITLGAGPVWSWGDQVMARVRARAAQAAPLES